MCVLHVTSDISPFKSYLENSKLPVYRCHAKGDTNVKRKTIYNVYGFSCTVSDRSWKDLAGQIDDAHKFLKKHKQELEKLIVTHDISDIYLDFPFECRLNNDNIFMQGEYLPANFLYLTGKLGINIALSHYPPSND